MDTESYLERHDAGDTAHRSLRADAMLRLTQMAESHLGAAHAGQLEFIKRIGNS